MRDLAKMSFTVGGVACILIGLAQIVGIFIGPSAYWLLGADKDMMQLAAAGSIIPALKLAIIAALLIIFGIYGLSGADRIRRLFLRKAMLTAICVLFMLRGLLLIQFIYWAISPSYDVDIEGMIFSLVGFLIGILYLYGTVRRWRLL